MYCPYCKEELKLVNGELYCDLGDCCFSKSLNNYFIGQINNLKNKEIIENENTQKENGRFYCVNCGNRMKRIEELHETCICCGFEIDKGMYFKIIELNPHK